MRIALIILILGFTKLNYAQPNYFQGKLIYKITLEGGIEEGFNPAATQRTKDQIGSIDAIVVYMQGDYYRAELYRKDLVQYFQYMPSVSLIYEFRTDVDYVLIYPSDYEPFPILQEGQTITHDSIIK